MKRCKLAKIRVEDGRVDYFALLEMDEQRTEMQLTVCFAATKAWTTTLGRKFFEDYGRRTAAGSTGEALHSVFEILGSPSLVASKCPSERYIYQISEVGLDIELSWKKAISSDDGEVVQKLGTAHLKADDLGRAFNLMLSFGIERIGELERDAGESIREHERLLDERRQAVDKLDKYIEQSTRTVAELYTKFSAVINEKKRRIRELVADRDHPEAVECTKKPVVPSKTTKNLKPTKPAMAPRPSRAWLNSPEDSGSDTDVERQFQEVPQKRAAQAIPEDDTDLMFSKSESPVVDIKPAAPRQKRRTTRPPRRGPVPQAKPVVFCSLEHPTATSECETMIFDSNELMENL